jgi:DNA-binding MarR family transcriptional regulator
MRRPPSEPRHRRGSILLELTRAAALIDRLFEHELGRTGRRPLLQGGLLALIHIHGPITPSELERESGRAGTTLRENVQALVKAGLVRRVPNPADGRSYFLDSTRKGQALLDAWVPAMTAVEEAIERELGRSLETYRRPLERLRQAAQAAGDR